MGAYGSPNLSNGSPNLSNDSSIFIKCPHCGNDTAKNYKLCPNCGKKIGKRFYQKWWFWILIIIFILFITPAEETYIDDNTNESRTNVVNIQESKEDFIMGCQTYTYKQLARNPEQFVGKKVKLKGKVIQVIQSDRNIELRVNITDEGYGYYTDTVYCTYKYSKNESRILEDDIIEFYGVCQGDVTYVSVLGTNVTLPYIQIKYTELISD